jgi:hypothetical protein
MAIEFKFKINEVIKVASVIATDENNYENDLSDVITKVQYYYIGVKEDHTFTWPMTLLLSEPSVTDDFISIENITEEVVLGWINDAEDFSDLNVFIELELDKKISPVEVPAYFDWLPDSNTLPAGPTTPNQVNESDGE